MQKIPFLAGLSLYTLTASIVAQATDLDPTISLRYATFDPIVESEPAVPTALRGTDTTQLWIVQFEGVPTDAGRAAIRGTGAQIHGYLPENAYVVRMPAATRATVAGLPATRWVGQYHPAYRVEPFLLDEIARGGEVPVRKYNIVVVDKRNDKPALGAAIRALGGTVTHEQEGSLLFEVQLSGEQLIAAARLDQVLWIDRWTAPEEDMDNARIQGGGNYVEAAGGYTGQGVNGHIYEGIEAAHQDFNNTPINVRSSGAAQDHGHATSGIVFGNGTSAPQARGMAPDAQPFYTNYSSVSGSRYQVVDDLVNIHEVMFTTASWGGGRTFSYTSTSAATDDIIFDHDMPWTQSQSNAGNQDSRPEAWAKNIFSIGGVRHNNNSNPNDDSWSGGGSTGPAQDGRIKPDLCAYYDGIWTSDRTGAAGYSSGNSYTSFGGTSGATPICAGHNALAIQMFTDGVFSPQRVPGGTRFQNRPHASTLKALQIVSAEQSSFTSTSTDNRREHCGWGFPNLQNMYDDRNTMHVVDETDVITQGGGTSYRVQVAAGRSELKVCMTFSDPPGNPSASQHAVNDLSLRVISPSGTVYHGNNGLEQGNFSTAGGSPNTIDTVENVFVQNPAAGEWIIEVNAPRIAQDGHVETPTIDSDYGLVIRGGTLNGSTGSGLIRAYGTSCDGTPMSLSGNCQTLNDTGGLTSVTMRNNVAYAFEVIAQQAMTVTGFEMSLATRSGTTETMSTGLYLPNAGGTPTTLVASGQWTVSTGAGFVQTTFAQPFNVTAGQTFFLFWQGNATGPACQQGAGTDVPYYRLTSGAWGPRVTGRFDWAYRVQCVGTVAVQPLLTASGRPNVGQAYTLLLRDAAANATAGFLIGFSNTALAGGAPLPIPLMVIGGGTCALQVAADLTATVPTNGNGESSFVINVPMDPGLAALSVFHQGYVFDSGANALGLVLTNGIETVINN